MSSGKRGCRERIGSRTRSFHSLRHRSWFRVRHSNHCPNRQILGISSHRVPALASRPRESTLETVYKSIERLQRDRGCWGWCRRRWTSSRLACIRQRKMLQHARHSSRCQIHPTRGTWMHRVPRRASTFHQWVAVRHGWARRSKRKLQQAPGCSGHM